MIQYEFLTDDISKAIHIRTEVFIKEQNVPLELEIDGTDDYAKNMVLIVDNICVGTGRLILEDEKMHIGRLAILKEHRGNGYATLIMKFLQKEAYKLGYTCVYLHAQTYAIDFYKKLGFSLFGDEFLDAGIPHINMKKTLTDENIG